MTSAFRPCAVVPTYDNPETVRAVVEGIRQHLPDVVVVDDGSGDAGRAACEGIAADGLATLRRRDKNGGKGAAVKTGLHVARELGFTHALQVDADGQHDLSCVPAFLKAGESQPTALVLGYPIYDETVPRARRVARRFTRFWVNLEIGRRRRIEDAMIGFRVYPVAAALDVRARGNRMDFDIEIAVRMARADVPLVNLPVGVRYLARDEGGVSHFQPLRDNLRFFWLHSKLCTQGVFRWLGRLVGIGRR